MIDEDVGLHLVETFDEACEFKRWLGERRGVLAIDTETDGFRWWDGHLRLVQFGDAKHGWAIPWERWRSLIDESIVQYEGPTVYHNAKFDMHWLIQNGIALPRHLVNDTSVMAGLLEPLKRTALKDVASRWVDHRSASGQTELKQAMARARWKWGTIPIEFEGYWVYSALDVVLTAGVYDVMWPKVEVEYRNVYDLEMRNIHILMDMERRGARVDLDYIARQQEELHAYAAEAAAWCEATYGFGPGQNKQVAAQLLRDDIVLTEKTDTGAWKLDKEVLEGLQHHPLARVVLKNRQAIKMANSYFGNFVDLAEGDIIHPGVRPMGAKTGRMSVANPSMQNLPRGRRVRDAFISREGHTMLGVDYSQVEYRLITHFSQDPGLLAAFSGGGDFFTNMARLIFQDESIQKESGQRQITKSAMYAKAFGAGVAKFAATAGIPLGEARQFNTKLESTFPGMQRLSRELIQEGDRHFMTDGEGWVKTTMGRRVAVEYKSETYKLVNAKIQGTAADLLKQVIVELDDAGVTQYLVMPVHDELIFDIPDEELEEVTATVIQVMTRDEYNPQFTVDPHTGHRWGDLK